MPDDLERVVGVDAKDGEFWIVTRPINAPEIELELGLALPEAKRLNELLTAALAAHTLNTGE